jgi:hypothetical protein
MIRIKKSLLSFLVCVTSALLLGQIASATTANFKVLAGQEESRTLNLSADDRVLIEFTVLGGQDGSTLHFYVTYPNGTVKDFGFVGNHVERFVCDRDGDCILRFSNAESSEDRLVSLDYEVEHYFFGIPQMLFLTIVIVCICLAAVAVFIFMGKSH